MGGPSPVLRTPGPWDEPFRDTRPDGPFVDRPGAPAATELDLFRLGILADTTKAALGFARSASLTFEWCRPIASGANSAALAVAALERLYEELQRIETAYGLELTADRKRGDA